MSDSHDHEHDHQLSPSAGASHLPPCGHHHHEGDETISPVPGVQVPEPTLTRRRMLTGMGGALMFAAVPGPAPDAAALPAVRQLQSTPEAGASRTSRITRGTQLVHADLHNHTMLSDGDGDPELAFASMREAGLDVAALTDHATMADGLLSALDPLIPPDGHSFVGLTRQGWRLTGALADSADRPGTFTAIRGFEWSHPILGHVNVWFTKDYTDVLNSAALMGPFYNWLTSERGLLGFGDGGADGVAGFNHPGREPGRFQEFRFAAKAQPQMVSLEMFNRRDDYLFKGWSDSNQTSPLVACLNAGWRTGLTGVTDEHGTDWGHPEGKGRTGLWVTENTRGGVFQAMQARRMFATRVSGLRIDAVANRVPMGGSIPLVRGDVQFRVDIDRGTEWAGKPLNVQVLRPGTAVPRVADVIEAASGRVTRFTVPVDVDDGNWIVLRISDPAEANATPGPADHPCNDWGVAYTSPWWLTPDASPAP